MKVAALLTQEKTSYVRIPRSLAQQLWSSQPGERGSHILRLQWCGDDEMAAVKTAYVGWAGGVVEHMESLIEIPDSLARGIGLEDDLLTSPHLLLDLQATEGVPVATRIAVEPETPDDWEILELHQNFVEYELLRQICVVNPGQKVTVWVQESIRIVLVVVEQLSEAVRLGTNSEVIIAPKLRHPPAPKIAGMEDSPREFAPSEPLRSLPRTTANKEARGPLSLIAALLHPSTLLTIPGVKEAVEQNLGRSLRLFALVWSGTLGKDISLQTACPQHERPQASSVSIIELLASSEVRPRHIELPLGTRVQLRLEPLSMIRLRLVSSAHVLEKKSDGQGIRLDRLRVLKGDEVAGYDWAQSGQESLQRFNNIPLVNGLIVALGGNDEGDVDVSAPLVRVVFADAGNSAMDSKTEEGEAGETKDAPTAPIVWLQTLSAAEWGPEEVADFPPMWSSLGVDKEGLSEVALADSGKKVLGELIGEVAPILFRPLAAQRTLLNTPSRGCALLCGPAGCGKTYLLRYFSDLLYNEPQCYAYCIHLDCRALRGRKMSEVKSELSDAVKEASYHSPSLLVLDDLDALIPAESEEPGAPNEQSWQIAEHLSSLLKAQRAAAARWAEVCRTSAGAHGLSAESSELQELCTVYQVAVVASCKDSQYLHHSLQECGWFDKQFTLGSLTSEDREEMLRALLKIWESSSLTGSAALSSNNAEDTDVDYQAIASLTEGYNSGDLNALLQRAMHRAVLRALREGEGSGLSSLRVTTADILKAEEGFTPSSLKGVTLFKSTIEWDDVGGLEEVRQTLKDTLELPTKYARLYERAPLRLPSGVMLYGPPGCGKTMLAAAVAHECGVNFISVKGPEVLNKYIGASEQAVRDLFAKAAGAAPCVLFLDEFDSIAPRRGADNTGVTDRVVNQLLTFLDGVETRHGVYVLAATSRPDMIDPALLRPGRLDKALYVGFPDSNERVQILHAVSRKMGLSDEAKEFLKNFGQSDNSAAFTGADLQALVYSAQLMAVHDNLDEMQTEGDAKQEMKEASEPSIDVRHLQKAAAEARPSVSTADRQRYQSIYDKFRSSRREASFAAADSDMMQTSTKQRTALA